MKNKESEASSLSGTGEATEVPDAALLIDDFDADADADAGADVDVDADTDADTDADADADADAPLAAPALAAPGPAPYARVPVLLTPIDAVIARVKKVYRGWSKTTPMAQMRRDWEQLFSSTVVAAHIEPLMVGGVGAEWVTAEGVARAQGAGAGAGAGAGTGASAAPGSAASPASHKAVLYFHGGGFQVGSPRSHRELMACISANSGCRVLGVDYRLAPGHRFPAALDDACAAFDGLLALGFAARDIALAGDSAGAGLALSTCLSLRDAGRELPAALVLMSPWTDLTASGESYETRAKADPVHQRPMITGMARNYMGKGVDASNPKASPLMAELHGLPPMLIQVGDRETLLSDSTALAEKARAAGVSVELQVFDGMIHVFQQFPAELAEARAALLTIGGFLRQHLALAAD